jgi:dihydrofolate synthase / folylpolyglutamate synthase
VPDSLDQWLAYQSQVHPQSIDLGLERLRKVLTRLQWRRPDVAVITVAGTNGKGSVSAYCAAIMTAAGYRVGTFTSPHLRDYRERIRIDENLVSAERLVSVFERIEHARAEVGLTFFEFNTLAALLAFEAEPLDAWVLEVGLGGRLDAVNVVDPDVAVVVSIGLDHQEYLGNTLAEIAREKAGIFRSGRPAVLGSRELPGIVAQIAREAGAPLKRLGVEFSYALQDDGWHYWGPEWDLPHLPAPALAGETQFANAATALAALEELTGATRAARQLTFSPAAVAWGLAHVRLPGRFQVITARGPSAPTWILDVAHNPAAAQVLAQNLRALRARTLAVCGILGDKDAAGIAAQLRDCIDAWWCIPTEGSRGQSGAQLAQVVRTQVSVPVQASDSLAEACGAALHAARPGDQILVFGSFHTVGPALDWLEAHDLLPPNALREYTAAPSVT